MVRTQIEQAIGKRFRQKFSRARLPGIRFEQGERHNSVRMILRPRAIGAEKTDNLNMQEASAAFETWTLLLCGVCGT